MIVRIWRTSKDNPIIGVGRNGLYEGLASTGVRDNLVRC